MGSVSPVENTRRTVNIMTLIGLIVILIEGERERERERERVIRVGMYLDETEGNYAISHEARIEGVMNNG